MNLLIVGSAPSTIHFFKNSDQDQLKNKIGNFTTLAFQAAFPSLLKDFDFNPDYWAWGDPDAAIDGLQFINSNLNNKKIEMPRCIIPSFLENIDGFSDACGTSQIQRPHNIKRKNIYESSVSKFLLHNKLELIPNSFTMKSLLSSNLPFPTPEDRFNTSLSLFHSVPFEGIKANHKNTFESKLTSYVLPIAYYLKAKNVYVLGFDHQGKGLNKSRHTVYEKEFPMGKRIKAGERVFNIIKSWCNDWVEYHGMNIYSIVPPELTRNNEYMKFIDIYG